MFNCERRRVSDGDGTGVCDGQWGGLQHGFWRKVSDCRWSRVFNCPSAGNGDNLPTTTSMLMYWVLTPTFWKKKFKQHLLVSFEFHTSNKSIYWNAITSQPSPRAFSEPPSYSEMNVHFPVFDSDHLKCDLITKNSTQNRFSLKSVLQGLFTFYICYKPQANKIFCRVYMLFTK